MSKLEKFKEELETKPKSVLESKASVSYNKEINTVSIQSRLDATVKITGTVTGQQYVFSGAGAIVEVSVLDKDEILNKKKGRSCCGGQSGMSIFVLV